jgi:putative addiction module killer protein
VNRIEMTTEFGKWLKALGKRDTRAQARVLTRMDRACGGNFGDCEYVGPGVSEMRIDHGPGYRIYYLKKADIIYLLLLGGSKSTQDADIKKSLIMASVSSIQDK